MTIVMHEQEKTWQQPYASFREIVYNRLMPESQFPFNTRQLTRIALCFWIAYFLILALVDWYFVAREPEVLLYYGVQVCNGVLILGLTLLPWHRFKSGCFLSEDAMLPIVIVFMAILPTLTVHLMLRLAPSEPLRSAEGMTLRLAPILLMGLLLTAWHYQWRYVALFCLATVGFNLLGIFALPGPGRGPQQFPLEGVLVAGIQSFSYLMVGTITNALASRLRAQQRSLEAANAQLRNQASTQVELTISHERNRMARELHDTLAHTLSGLSVQLQTVKAYWDLDPTASQKMLDDALVATRSGLQETRYALKSLRATPLDDLGLSLAIRQLAEAAAARANLKLHLAIPESLSSLAIETSQCLYRVAQEAIMNVVYHAAAQNLSVSITESVSINENRKKIKLTVNDDGIGFDPNGVHLNHWGVTGMRERAQLMGGLLLIESEIDGGTTVNLLLPEKQL